MIMAIVLAEDLYKSLWGIRVINLMEKSDRLLDLNDVRLRFLWEKINAANANVFFE